jgi:hypothetical protein
MITVVYCGTASKLSLPAVVGAIVVGLAVVGLDVTATVGLAVVGAVLSSKHIMKNTEIQFTYLVTAAYRGKMAALGTEHAHVCVTKCVLLLAHCTCHDTPCNNALQH